MGKLILSSFMIMLFLSCKEGIKTTLQASSNELDFEIEKLAKAKPLNRNVTTQITDWVDFTTLETAFEALYTIENNEDLKFVIDDLLEKEKLLAKSDYPISFDIPQIKSRQKVFKNCVFKVKASLDYNIEIGPSIFEMILAYNAYRKQFNVIASNILDEKLILDEE